MRTRAFRAALGVVLLSSVAGAATKPTVRPIDTARVDQIAAMLDDTPFIAGPPITDRGAWAKLAAQRGFRDFVNKAEAALAKPMPAMTAEIYGEYLKTGTRTKHYADVRADRYGRIATYTMAECIENKGRFIKPLQEVIRSVCDEPTWTYNFHDTKLDYWSKRAVYVDLGAPVPALDMTEAAGLLQDKLDAATRKLIHDECCRRILDPYRASLTGTGPAMWWMSAEMNWNPVCTYGVLGVALGTAIDRHDRALLLEGAEMYEPDFIKGFGGDGYCAEGMGYWNYGFGHFLYLAELASQATHGKLDLYDIPGAKLAALYPVRMAIVNGVTPAYADGGGGGAPTKSLFTFATQRYRTGVQTWQEDSLVGWQTMIQPSMLFSLPNSATTAGPTTAPACYPPAPLRDYFQNSGILTCRPAEGGDFGVSLKGGNNDEPHNHNDLGTFVVVKGDQPLIVDPGNSPYTATTFSARRYENPMLSSFGHPVPRLAGMLQRAGKNAVARVTRADFTDQADDYELDLKSAYPAVSLTTVRRAFHFARGGHPQLTVTDHVEFAVPESYESALITYGQWAKNDDNSLTIWQNGQAIRVAVDTGDEPWTVSAEAFGPNVKKPTRIAITLTKPATSFTVVLTIAPATPPASK